MIAIIYLKFFLIIKVFYVKSAIIPEPAGSFAVNPVFTSLIKTKLDQKIIFIDYL